MDRIDERLGQYQAVTLIQDTKEATSKEVQKKTHPFYQSLASVKKEDTREETKRKETNVKKDQRPTMLQYNVGHRKKHLEDNEMITKNMMDATEIVLMPYFFDLNAWLGGRKVVDQKVANMTRMEMLEEIKKDFPVFDDDGKEDYSEVLSDVVATLSEMTDDDFQKFKLELLEWEPATE